MPVLDYVDFSTEDLKARIPQRYSAVWSGTIETMSESDMPLPIKNPVIPVWRIHSPDLALRARTPIGLRICFDAGLYFAENDALNIIGTGETAEEAVQDSFQHIANFYQYYRGLGEDQVTGDALRLKRLFAEVFEEDAA